MYLICGLFSVLHCNLRELALIWGTIISPHDDASWTIWTCFTSGQQWRVQSQMSLHFLPVVNSVKKFIKVTPFKSASRSSNLFLVSLAAFSILWALFLLLPQHSQRPVWRNPWHMLPLFCPFWEMLVQQTASSNGWHYHILTQVHLKSLNTGGTVYTHWELLQNVCCLQYSVVFFGPIKT